MYDDLEPKEQTQTLAMHSGIVRKWLTLFEGVALMLSGTVGAGVLGLPFAVAKAGVLIGILYIVCLGVLMMGLNLMLGEVAVRTKGSFQLVGFAKKYLGIWGKILMTIMMYGILFGALVIYIIGEGETLAALFGGNAFVWSIGFFAGASFLVTLGMKTVKTAELILTIGIVSVVILIAAVTAPHVSLDHLYTTNLAYVFLPYGVVLFSLHGTTAIPEMHSLMRHDPRSFKKAIVIGGATVILLYSLFSLVVVGVTGPLTTEIATIGLGERLGRVMFISGNVFAFFAMATSFLLTGVALKDSFSWDYKMPTLVSTLLTIGIPFCIFMLGLRSFVSAIDIVGGIFGSIEMLLILLIFWRAKKRGDLPSHMYRVKHVVLLAVLLLIVLGVGFVRSVVGLI